MDYDWIDKYWTDINVLSDKDMKVKWKCEDGKIDVGFYHSKTGDFATIDPLTFSPITHWKPF